MNDNELIPLFLKQGIFKKGYSSHTVDAYQRDLKKLFDFLQKESSNSHICSHVLLTDYLLQIRKEEYSFSTISRYLFCFRSFFFWMVSNGYREDDPSVLLDAPKLWSTLPELLSANEIDQLIKSISKGKKHGLRIRTVIETLYGCGLRVSELINLRALDIRLKEKFLICKGKGDKERVVPFGNNLKKCLEKWVKYKKTSSSTSFQKSDYLFVSQKGSKLSRQHIWYEIKQQAIKAGIQKKIYPHIFRHSYATHLLTNGGDLRSVQELLGHADISTTQKYTQVDQGFIHKQYMQYHPRAKRGNQK